MISQLLIIDEIMYQIQWSLKLEEVPRPCDYAELMVGTGLGAYVNVIPRPLNIDSIRFIRVVVLLLARLRLTAREALIHIIKFGQRAFSEPGESTNGPKFDTEKLYTATRDLLKDNGINEETKMIEDVINGDQTYT